MVLSPWIHEKICRSSIDNRGEIAPHVPIRQYRDMRTRCGETHNTQGSRQCCQSSGYRLLQASLASSEVCAGCFSFYAPRVRHDFAPCHHNIAKVQKRAVVFPAFACSVPNMLWLRSNRWTCRYNTSLYNLKALKYRHRGDDTAGRMRYLVGVLSYVTQTAASK